MRGAAYLRDLGSISKEQSAVINSEVSFPKKKKPAAVYSGGLLAISKFRVMRLLIFS